MLPALAAATLTVTASLWVVVMLLDAGLTVTAGVALFTVIVFVAAADAAFDESPGVNVAFSVCDPAARTVPDAGE